MICTLCETPLVNKADDYFFICGTCGAYVKDKIYYITPTEERKRYKEHNNDVNDVRYQEFTSPISREILENFTPEQLGLDYGCGTGPVISKVLKDNGYEVKLYDPYFYPSEEYLNHQYDFIFCCEVFEHFYQPKQEIEKLIGLLKFNGHLYIMTHLYNSQTDFQNWYYKNDPTHVFIYTVKTMQFITRRYKLDLIIQDDRMIILKKFPVKV